MRIPHSYRAHWQRFAVSLMAAWLIVVPFATPRDAAAATAQGALTALQGGRFQDSFLTSAASSVGSNFNKAVGDWAQQNGFTAGDFSKVLLHAGIGAAQAGLTKQNVAAGAIGGATAELLSPINDSLQAETGNKLAGELLTIGGSPKSPVVAAYALTRFSNKISRIILSYCF